MTLPLAPLSNERLDRLDRYLQTAVHDLLKNDDRVRGLGVDVTFRGGVAHVTGSVEREEELGLVRTLVGRLGGVLGVWDRVRVGGRQPMILDIGCGDSKQFAENIGVDVRRAEGVDVVADLSEGIPFPDDSADRVFAVHILEHLIDFLPLVDECHRVLRPGGVLHVLSPWWRYVNAVADPTHVRLLDVQTIKGICSRADSDLRWYPLHAGCDGASIFADLMPLQEGEAGADAEHLARYFD